MNEKTGQLTKFGRIIHRIWNYSSVKCLFEKFTEKLVQWIENISQGNLGMFLRKKT